MITIAQVSKRIQTVLTESATQIAAETGLIVRQRAVTGANLCQTLILGWLSNPEASLEELCQTGMAVGLQITPQGLAQRFTPAASAFLQRLLAETVRVVLEAEPVTLPLLQRFNGVYLSDSSVIQLPDALKEQWAGFGGRVATSGAAIKLQVRWNLLRGGLEGPILVAGRRHDRTAEAYHEPLPPRALRLADLGYWKLAGLAALSARGCFWLSRLQVQTTILDEEGRRWSQSQLVRSQARQAFDCSVRLGVKQQLPARLLGVPVPATVAAARRRRLKEQARSQGQTVSQRRLALADWTLLVTNVPAHLLQLEEALLLARVRWQIELLFKLWKSAGGIATWRTRDPWRILCELYAKLIAVVIQHWLFLVGNWSAADRSWLKATKTVRQHALSLALALPSRRRLSQSIQVIVRCLNHGCRINKSRQSPRHFQLLAALTTHAFP